MDDEYIGTRQHGAFKCIELAGTLNCAPWGLNGPSPAAPELVTAITSDGASAPLFWMATTSGLFKGSEDASGVTWTYSTGGNGYTVSDVEVDPHCPSRVYAALGFAFIYGQHRGGIRFSSNAGSAWVSITAGTALHQGPVSQALNRHGLHLALRRRLAANQAATLLHLAVLIVSRSGRQFRPTPHFFHHSTTATKVRGLQIRQSALHIDQAAPRGLQQNTQSARDGKALFTRDADTELFIYQQQVGVFLLGQLNGLPFSRVKFRKSWIWRRCNVANDEP